MKIAISTSKNKNKNKRFKITISSWYFKNTFEICNPTSKPFTLNSVSFIMQILTMLLNLVSSLRITLSCLGKLTCSCDGTSSSTYGRHAFFSGMSYTVACVWVSVCLHIVLLTMLDTYLENLCNSPRLHSVSQREQRTCSQPAPDINGGIKWKILQLAV